MKTVYRQCASAAAVLLIAVGVTTSAVITGSSQAQNVDKMPQQGQLLKQLNLTPAQMQQLQTIREKNKDAMRSNMQQMRQTQQELRTLMVGNANAEQLRTKFNEVQTLKQQTEKMRFESMLAMREILTPEQRTKIDQLMQQNKDGMRQRMRDRFQQRQNQNPTPNQ